MQKYLMDNDIKGRENMDSKVSKNKERIGELEQKRMELI